MREIAIFKPEFTRGEQAQINTLLESLWDVLTSNDKPTIIDNGVPGFIMHSIKVVREPDGSIVCLDTSMNPYMPIYNRWLLRLITENILED